MIEHGPDTGSQTANEKAQVAKKKVSPNSRMAG
jgi:hypothetical protein